MTTRGCRTCASNDKKKKFQLSYETDCLLLLSHIFFGFAGPDNMIFGNVNELCIMAMVGRKYIFHYLFHLSLLLPHYRRMYIIDIYAFLLPLNIRYQLWDVLRRTIFIYSHCIIKSEHSSPFRFSLVTIESLFVCLSKSNLFFKVMVSVTQRITVFLSINNNKTPATS